MDWIIWIVSGVAFGGIVTFLLCRAFMKRGGEGVPTPVDGQVLDSQKDRYERLLGEARARCDELDAQLKAALEGKADVAVSSQLEAVEKLRKQVKDLEDDLDDKEDDLSDVKKKLSRKDDEIMELQDSLRSEQKKSKVFQEDLQSTKERLEQTISDLNLKVGALRFVQEILSAKDSDTADARALVKSIDQFESFVKGQYLDLNSFLYNAYSLAWNNVSGQKGYELKKDVVVSSFDQWASTKKKSWLSGKTTVAFVGEFSAGKTSIVNRILSQDRPDVPQLPVSVEATTAIPTYIAGGKIPTYNFISGEGRRKTILESTFKMVSKDLLEQIKGVSNLIKYFVMEYNNPNLVGLSILDTPGFNSNDKEDSMRTIEVVNECDALFWVVDVNLGTLNRSSLAIIKEKLNKPLYIVINKVDTKSGQDIQRVENLIRKTLADEGLQAQQIIRFSNKAPLKDIMEPIKKVSRISARETFVGDIKGDIEEILGIMDQGVKDLTEKYNSVFQEGEAITDQFIDGMQALRVDCETAESIPDFRPGVRVFGIGTDDRYVIPMDKYLQLQNLLDNISDAHLQTLASIFDSRVEKAAEIQQAWSDLCDLKVAWQRTDECRQQFNKIVKNIT